VLILAWNLADEIAEYVWLIRGGVVSSSRRRSGSPSSTRMGSMPRLSGSRPGWSVTRLPANTPGWEPGNRRSAQSASAAWSGWIWAIRWWRDPSMSSSVSPSPPW